MNVQWVNRPKLKSIFNIFSINALASVYLNWLKNNSTCFWFFTNTSSNFLFIWGVFICIIEIGVIYLSKIALRKVSKMSKFRMLSFDSEYFVMSLRVIQLSSVCRNDSWSVCIHWDRCQQRDEPQRMDNFSLQLVIILIDRNVWVNSTDQKISCFISSAQALLLSMANYCNQIDAVLNGWMSNRTCMIE